MPALVPWTQRSRGQLAAMSAGACQSKSKLTSARCRSAAQRSRSAADSGRGTPMWSHGYRGTGSRSGSYSTDTRGPAASIRAACSGSSGDATRTLTLSDAIRPRSLSCPG